MRDRDSDKVHTILVLQDERMASALLPLILKGANYQVVEIYPNAFKSPDNALMNVADLLILSVDGPETVERLQAVRASTGNVHVPALGFIDGPGGDFDRSALERAGIVGLVDRRSSPDHIVFRVDQIVRAGRERRSHQRVTGVVPVEVTTRDARTTEFAVSISARGVGLASTRFIEPNTDVSLEFLDDELSGLGTINGRVVRTAEVPSCLPTHRIGIVFYPLEDAAQEVLDRRISSMLVRGAK